MWGTDTLGVTVSIYLVFIKDTDQIIHLVSATFKIGWLCFYILLLTMPQPQQPIFPLN